MLTAITLGAGLAASLCAAGPSAALEPGPLVAPMAPTPIVGGDPVEPGAYPAVVSVGGWCTGTLLSPELVITAAHCLDAPFILPELVEVRLGDRRDAPTQRVDVRGFGVHPEFCDVVSDDDCPDDEAHDYAWIRLAEPAAIDPAALPSIITDEALHHRLVRKGAPVELVGFGEDDDGVLGVKRQVQVSLTSLSASGEDLRVGGDGRDSCDGDSGGPAFARLDDGTLALMGVLSRGSDPCGKGGIYGAPLPALCWIRDDSGVDVVPAGCEGCDCIDLTPREEDARGCAVTGSRPEGAAWWLVPIVALGSWRRRRDRARRARRARAALGLGLLLPSACTEPPDDDATTVPFLSTTGGDTGEPTTTELTTTATDATAGPADDTTESTGSDETTTTTGEPACPPLPDPAPAWLMPLQEQVVARLSGAQELSPGVVLSDRATPQRRAATVSFLQDQWAQLGLRSELHAYSDAGTNVYATLPATIPTDHAVVIGAHFDTVPGSPGANDNATGVAMVLALGRWLQDLPCRELNVILVLFDQEEIGLVGSQAFASWLVDQPVQVVSVHTIDQMGWDSDGDRALELERADPGLYELYEAAEPLAPGDTPLIPTNTGFTDHVSFRELGFAAVGLTEEYVSGDTTPHYHLPSDTFDTVDLSYLASSTALLHVTIGQLVAAEPD